MQRNRFYNSFFLVITILVLLLGDYREVVAAVSGFSEAPENYFLVGRDNCGSDGYQPHLELGNNYRYPEADLSLEVVSKDSPLRTVSFHGERVIYKFRDIEPGACCKLRLVFLSDGERTQKVSVNGMLMGERVVLVKGEVVEKVFDLPKAIYQEGEIEISIEKIYGPNAVVSVIELFSTARPRRSLRLEQFSDKSGRIAGRLTDSLIEPAAGADILVRLGQTEEVVRGAADENGYFSVELDRNWAGSTQQNIRIEARHEELETLLEVGLGDVFWDMVRLYPKSVEVAGVANDRIQLNGAWRFNSKPGADFWKLRPGKMKGWSYIKVPGEWVMQNFTVPAGGEAAYYRTITIPADFTGKRIRLRCDAVYSMARVYVNGNFVGAHEGGFTPFELDVTDFAQPGQENVIALAVQSDSLSDVLASGNQYAAHNMGGISRSIYLFAVSPVNVSRLHVETEFDNDYRDARMKVLVSVANQSGKMVSDGRLSFKLFDSENKEVALSVGSVAVPRVGSERVVEQVVEIPVADPKKWDTEHPNLYKLHCTLTVGSDDQLQTVVRRFGFRQVQVRGNQVYVNGSSVKLRGVCRHESHPLFGRSLTPQLWEEDVRLFRLANINYIRTSHYPPAAEFIAACDEAGIFVEQEAPLCWVGHGANKIWRSWNSLGNRFLPTIVRQTQEMIERDRSCPAVIIWSLANESVWSENFAKSLEMADAADPTRPKTFHDQAWGGYNNSGSTSLPVANYHYPGPGGPEKASQQKRPMLFGEYCHLNTYNRREILTDPGLRDFWGQGLQKMWDSIYRTEACLGGAIWSGIDDLFYLPSGMHTKYVGYGEWGPVDGWRRKKPEYWHIKKAYSPIRIQTVQVDVPEAGKPIRISLENRYDFTNLSEVRTEWKLGNLSGTVQLDVPPRSAGVLEIASEAVSELFASGKDFGPLELEFRDPRGFVADVYAIELGNPPASPEGQQPDKEKKLELSEDGMHFIVQSGVSTWYFDRKKAVINKVVMHDQPLILGGGLSLVMTPLAGGSGQIETDPFELNEYWSSWIPEQVEARQDDQGIVVTMIGQYEQARGTFSVVFSKDGQVKIDYEFDILQAVNPREIGIALTLDSGFDRLNWHRKGQWTVYPQDHIGRCKGSARAFPRENWRRYKPNLTPVWLWNLDTTSLGSNDFRSSKFNIINASLTNDSGRGIRVLSDGSQTVRAYVVGGAVRLEVLDYANGGAEPFFSSHLSRKPLKEGDRLSGTVRLQILDDK